MTDELTDDAQLQQDARAAMQSIRRVEPDDEPLPEDIETGDPEQPDDD